MGCVFKYHDGLIVAVRSLDEDAPETDFWTFYEAETPFDPRGPGGPA